jgi:uncharacterized damage-inducible protein DinB
MTASEAKATADTLLNLWEFECAATLKVLAAVKDDNRTYKPDEKSRTAWELATHLAVSDIWFLQSIIDGKFVWDQEGSKKLESQFESAQAIADYYGREFTARVQQLRALPGEKLEATNTFFEMLTWPNVQFIGFAQNHSMHHRGQLAAYLRAMGSKVPAIYGASADEPAGT